MKVINFSLIHCTYLIGLRNEMNLCDSPAHGNKITQDKVQVGLYNQPRQEPLIISLRLLTRTTRGLAQAASKELWE